MFVTFIIILFHPNFKILIAKFEKKQQFALNKFICYITLKLFIVFMKAICEISH